MTRVELVGRPHSANIFVAYLGRMAKSFQVAFVSVRAFNVDSARVPVPILCRRLRPPMGPDAELRIFEPLGDLICFQSFESAVEGSFFDFGQRALAECPRS